MVVEDDAGSEKTGVHFPATIANKGTQLSYKRPIYQNFLQVLKLVQRVEQMRIAGYSAILQICPL